MESPNKDLADALYKISIYYSILGDKYRSSAYLSASDSTRNLTEEVTSGAEAKAAVVSGIGESIERDIDEFVKTGKISRLDKLKSENPQVEQSLSQLTRIHGISVKRAVKLYNSGIRSIQDLWDSNLATENERLSIVYLLQLEQRIPRVEMNYMKSIFNEAFFLSNYYSVLPPL
jgi:DNA polymerase/3'-5' exonuclease PolX